MNKYTVIFMKNDALMHRLVLKGWYLYHVYSAIKEKYVWCFYPKRQYFILLCRLNVGRPSATLVQQ